MKKRVKSFWGYAPGILSKYLPEYQARSEDIEGGDFAGAKEYSANERLTFIVENDKITHVIVRADENSQTFIPELNITVPCGSGDIYRSLGKPTVEDCDNNGVILEYQYKDFNNEYAITFFINDRDRVYEIILTSEKNVSIIKYVIATLVAGLSLFGLYNIVRLFC